MARFYLPPPEWDFALPALRGDEARHAVRVLRLREGDRCDVFDGRGRAAIAVIAGPGTPAEVPLRIERELAPLPELPALTLCQSIPKGGNMELIIQKAVELGVTSIVPLITEHTVVRLSDKDRLAKQAKWQRTALEACKQCGQNVLPVVAEPLSFSQWIARAPLAELRVIASLAPGARPVRDVLEEARADGCRSAMVLVGPEGDFSPAETGLALQSGWLPVTLGPIVMRVETATFFCLSVLRYSLD